MRVFFKPCNHSNLMSANVNQFMYCQLGLINESRALLIGVQILPFLDWIPFWGIFRPSSDASKSDQCQHCLLTGISMQYKVAIKTSITPPPPLNTEMNLFNDEDRQIQWSKKGEYNSTCHFDYSSDQENIGRLFLKSRAKCRALG